MNSIDVIVLAYKADGETAARLTNEVAETSSRRCRIQFWDNSGHQRNLSMVKNDLATLGKGDWILWANADVRFSPGWDDRLIGFLETHPKAAAALPLPAGDERFPRTWKEDLAGFEFSNGRPSGKTMEEISVKLGNRSDHHIYDGKDLFCPFFALLMHRATWQEIKGFDERFRFMGADREMTFRLAKMNRFVAGVRSCAFWHAGGGSINSCKAPGDVDLEAEWKYRHELLPKITSGQLPWWHELSKADRLAIRNDPGIAQLLTL